MTAYERLKSQPIEKLDEDQLAWGRYAKLIANAIKNADVSQSSCVLALHGDWGSGKSSLKNLAIEYLGKDWKDGRILNFSPWLISDSEQIHEQFFKDLSITAGVIEPTMAKDFNLLFLALSKMTGTVSHAVKALPALAAFILLWNHQYAEAALAKTAGDPLAEAAAKAAEEASKAAKEASELAKEEAKTLDRVRTDLKEKCQLLSKPILVVLDDIDRLTPDETHTIFQLIKANCDFPNIIFLLLYQRDVVEKALGELISGSLRMRQNYGRSFLEKIIQIPLVVPSIAPRKLASLLVRELEQLFLSTNFDSALHSASFEHLIARVSPLFDSLRQVQRYVTALKFTLSAFNESNAYVINPYDIAAFEAIRLFEPEFHKAMKDYTSWLLSGSNTDQIDILFDKLGVKERKPLIQSIFAHYVPATRSGYARQHLTEFQNMADKRICAFDNLHNYFALSSILESTTLLDPSSIAI